MDPTVLAAATSLQNPLFWAVVICWIMTVVLHEFAHGLVAHFGGDYTIAERGGLSLNPLQYIHPVYSLLMPAVFLMIGGIPLPGGATYIRTDLLRNKWWDSAVSFAGPAMNFLIFLIGAAALHPRMGWIDPAVSSGDWTPAQRLVATVTFLEIFSVFLNLIPSPPLDGFGIIAPHLNPRTREKLSTPPLSTGLMVMTFIIIFSSPQVMQYLMRASLFAFRMVGFHNYEAEQIVLVAVETLYER